MMSGFVLYYKGEYFLAETDGEYDGKRWKDKQGNSVEEYNTSNIKWISIEQYFVLEDEYFEISEVDEENKTLFISGLTDNGWENLDENNGALLIPAQLKLNDGNEYSVIGLDTDCFCDCEELISATVSEGIEIICSCAFYNCANLEYLSLPSTFSMVGGVIFDNKYDFTSRNVEGGLDLRINMTESQVQEIDLYDFKYGYKDRNLKKGSIDIITDLGIPNETTITYTDKTIKVTE